MRFIRKNGRVIPIENGPAKYSAKKEYVKTAKIAGVTAAFAHVAAVAGVRKSKPVMFSALAGVVGSSVANMIHQVRASRRESAAKGNNQLTNLLKHTLVDAGVATLGKNASNVLFKPSVKASIVAGEAVRGGIRGGANALHGKVKPYTAAYAEGKKFKRARFVNSKNTQIK